MMTIDKNTKFYTEEETLPGVSRTAGNVKKDMELITGCLPASLSEGESAQTCIIYGTLGHSRILQALETGGKLDLSPLRNKREVYSFQVIPEPTPEIARAVVIAGSDKRGTIYGLYHLSELMGVSPLVNWNHVWPEKRETISLPHDCSMISKEPSVKYRGIFINDEWPAFGTWATEHFGGIHAECYEHVFELLLRLKGNYLWPAMWDSNFSLDGPGLLSAQLADELGIVISTSHHEPCMRSGGEYGLFRGKDSPYGDAWDFLENPNGITNFWRDGLIRNRPFENVITMGMRGENDTAIMENHSLADNIALLRQVLKVQNQLIRENINADLSKVPRQIVLFTEVESFFYGSQDTPGLMSDPELEGVTLMLSDNNQGSTRTLPAEEMRGHAGGYGMYYHMDMHGGPHAFEWIGSTYLPKLWEQMTAAYEYGVREIWVTNIGDIGTQEYGLSFFLDLAYDIQKWGGTDSSVTRRYTAEWIRKQFGHCFSEKCLTQMEDILWDYNRLLARRKHEVMNNEVYHPVHFGEAQHVLEHSENILRVCAEIKRLCPGNMQGAYISLLHYPACGTANLMRMWILSGRNQLYAKQNRVVANDLADEISSCMETDQELVEEYHRADDGRFYGFGLSEHIGFTNWNCEDNKYPPRTYIYPASRPRMILARLEDEHYLTGEYWSGRPQTWSDALRPDVDKIEFEIACGSRMPITYAIETSCKWLRFSSMAGTVSKSEKICVHIDKSQLTGRETGCFTVENTGCGKATVYVEAEGADSAFPAGVFLETDGYIAMEASHFIDKEDIGNAGFKILYPYGRTDHAVKVFPVTADFCEEAKRPWVAYDFCAAQQGRCQIRFYLAATTPVVYKSEQYIGFSVNEDAIQIVNTVRETDKPFFLSRQWEQEAYEQIKLTDFTIYCKKGVNRLYFYGMSPAVVLERIVISRDGVPLPVSYLGPRESYRKTTEKSQANLMVN